MADDEDDEETRPQRKQPLLGVPGWLLFVCLFLPTLRVCGDPTAPIEFPPSYAVYLGALAIGAMAFTTVLRTRRIWFSIWFTVWYLTAVGWLALVIGSVFETGGIITALVGVVFAFLATPAFHRQEFTPRGFWVGGIAHGVVAIGWYVLLSGDSEAMWGAVFGLGVSIAFTVASAIALGKYTSELARERRANEPAPLPVARVVERS